jgi:hypothetical protein
LQTNRKDEFIVIIAKPGYHTVEIPVHTRIAGEGAVGFAGNVLIGGVVGMAADAATGATLEHFPNPVTVTLTARKKGEPDSVIKITPGTPTAKLEEVNPQ